MPEKRNRINSFHKWSLIVISVFVDLMQAIISLVPFVGVFVASIFSVFMNFVLLVWFMVLGVGFADKPSRLFINIATRGLEFIPLISALPLFTVGTSIIIYQVQKEDKKYNEKKLAEYLKTSQ